jgi:hypothetical protein
VNCYQTANALWVGLSTLQARRFRRALDDPEAVQASILRQYLRVNGSTAFGRKHRFAQIDSVDRYRRQVPLSTYDELHPWIEHVQEGESAVLTREPVHRLVPTSGSTAARKLIPYTRSFQTELNNAIGPWIVDLLRRIPDAGSGPAYWSISPMLPEPAGHTTAVPVGFDDDGAYLGGLRKRLIDSLLPVPSSVRFIQDIDALRYTQLRFLLGARELRLISVWHPSFLTLLLEPLPAFWDRLVDDLAEGRLRPPAPIDEHLRQALERGLRPDPARARELRSSDPTAWSGLWPHLALISCWGDGPAASACSALRERFPGVEIQPKGLLATEAVVTLPYAGGLPVALRSHFYEFLDDARSHLTHELRRGAEYSVVVTTGGGLYRYRLNDRVRVDGFLGRSPTLRFVGREDGVSDRFGEKLSEAYVSDVLHRLLQPFDLGVSFAMLAPNESDEGVGYTLYLEARREPPPGLGRRCDQLLSNNPHYEYCRRIGQLGPARVFRVAGRAHETYLEWARRRGRRLGDIKPVALSTEPGWSRMFSGSYVAADRVGL